MQRPDVRERVRSRIDLEGWWLAVPYAVVVALEWRVVEGYGDFTTIPAITEDAALFLFAGLRMASGRMPYLHTWDVKPPAVHETVALAALLVGGDRWRLYVITTALSGAALALSVLLLTLIVYQLTGSRLGAVVAGLAPLTYQPAYLMVPTGIRPKYFAVCFGLLGIHLALRDEPLAGRASTAVAAGVASALAAAYWQAALVFPVVVLWLVGHGGARGDEVDRWRRVRQVLAGIGGAAAVVLAPFVFAGGLLAVVDQAVLTPLLFNDSGLGMASLRKFVDSFEVAWLVPAVGLAGLVAAYRTRHDRERGLDAVVALAPVLWFAFVLALDFDGTPDAIPLAVVSGLGAGFYVGHLLGREVPTVAGRDRRMALLLVALVVVSGVLMLPWVERADPNVVSTGNGDLAIGYWNGQTYDRCHLRFSSSERAWIDAYGADPESSRCRVHWLP